MDKLLNLFKCFIIYFLFSITLIFSAKAKNFGTQGNIYQIYEQSFLRMIDERLKNVNIEKEKQKIQEIAKARVNEPISLDSIKRARKTRIYRYDPTYTLDKDIVLPCGKLLHKAGTQVNPLDHMDWDGELVFIDSRDKKQIYWLKNYLANRLSNNIKVILTAGRPLDFELEINRKVYFDQQAILTDKFGIRCVPATVVQDGKFLKIIEIEV